MSLDIKVRVNLVRNKKENSSTEALATAVINEAIALNKIAVKKDKDGKYFVSMYRAKNSQGEYEDVFHPITREARDQMNKLILDEFHKKLAEPTNQKPVED